LQKETSAGPKDVGRGAQQTNPCDGWGEEGKGRGMMNCGTTVFLKTKKIENFIYHNTLFLCCA